MPSCFNPPLATSSHQLLSLPHEPFFLNSSMAASAKTNLVENWLKGRGFDDVPVSPFVFLFSSAWLLTKKTRPRPPALFLLAHLLLPQSPSPSGSPLRPSNILQNDSRRRSRPLLLLPVKRGPTTRPTTPFSLSVPIALGQPKVTNIPKYWASKSRPRYSVGLDRPRFINRSKYWIGRDY